MRSCRRLLLLTLALSAALSGCAKDEEPTAAPSPPEVLGTYTATISPTELKGAHPDIPDVFVRGEWTLELLEGSYQLSSDAYGRTDSQLSVSEGEIRFEDLPAPAGAFNCVDDQGGRADTRAEATGTYSYELSGDELVLMPKDEPCVTRGFVMERTWTRT